MAIFFTAIILPFKSITFQKYSNKFIEIEEQLKTEPVGITRLHLISMRHSLLNDYD